MRVVFGGKGRGEGVVEVESVLVGKTKFALVCLNGCRGGGGGNDCIPNETVCTLTLGTCMKSRFVHHKLFYEI